MLLRRLKWLYQAAGKNRGKKKARLCKRALRCFVSEKQSAQRSISIYYSSAW
jgi:hypothetical protein